MSLCSPSPFWCSPQTFQIARLRCTACSSVFKCQKGSVGLGVVVEQLCNVKWSVDWWNDCRCDQGCQCEIMSCLYYPLQPTTSHYWPLLLATSEVNQPFWEDPVLWHTGAHDKKPVASVDVHCWSMPCPGELAVTVFAVVQSLFPPLCCLEVAGGIH